MIKYLILEDSGYKFYYYPGQHIILTQEGKQSGMEVKIVYTKEQLLPLFELFKKLQGYVCLELLANELLVKDTIA